MGNPLRKQRGMGQQQDGNNGKWKIRMTMRQERADIRGRLRNSGLRDKAKQWGKVSMETY